ncbi:plasmid pRiA4b ORF-3 family protein [Salegentibacter sp. JZCK2]|uniref:plasmid pRiA4b ORF-3 family protein n=1 Tax=Salegentibacter tibetensis TaxID=2873600 RepID=UPI001CC9F018|nr:plasmid pRiA4b ORF-3 family protein [Salegentibacter tibetensis]MBZ9728747.1 plasmid pRiA4b ORF-3 family protein [Salegentibacter tibetensis]
MFSPIKIKIDLKDLPHKCTRTLLLPEDITMLQLHFLIQESFGWLNAHLFEFSDNKGKAAIRVGVPDDFEDDFDFIEMAAKQDASKVKLKEKFLEETQGKAFWYWYDFGDDWWHHIKFLKVSQKDLNQFKEAPICIKAEGKCPPEDVGGPWGYAEFLEIIKNKKHPEHKETRIWYGLEKDEKYDETFVNLEDINFLLDEFYHSENWKNNSYELF